MTLDEQELADFDAWIRDIAERRRRREELGVVIVYDLRPKDLFPVPVVDPPPDPAARARARARAAEIRAGVRRYLTDHSPSDKAPVP